MIFCQIVFKVYFTQKQNSKQGKVPSRLHNSRIRRGLQRYFGPAESQRGDFPNCHRRSPLRFSVGPRFQERVQKSGQAQKNPTKCKLGVLIKFVYNAVSNNIQFITLKYR